MSFLWAALLGVALGQDSVEPGHDPSAVPFSRFDHGTHQRIFDKVDLACSGCHAFGGAAHRPVSDELEAQTLRPPEGSCHYCHQGDAPNRWAARAPSQCLTCHDTVEPPTTHGAAWVQTHGPEARIGVTDCESCHQTGFCVRCHERRAPVANLAHAPGWLSIHSIAAQVDPAQCGTCHLQADCMSCHATADGRFP